MLEGKVAVITGSTDGIGLAIARALAAQKVDIMLNGFGEASAIDALRRELAQAHGVRVCHSPADLSVGTEATQLIETATRELGRVDILVNNAGTQHKSVVEQHPLDKWNLVLGLNLTAPFQTIRAALPQMRERGWGRIINIASIYGLVGGYERSSYVASKHGLVGLTKAVALETAGSPITCNAICPGDVSTRIFYKTAKDLALRENISREEAQRRVAATNMPSGNTVAPEQVAALAAFLCSASASEMRGAALSMDGGWQAR
ncbi:MAG: 3-hydroxybutyrate dehydrogenase [Burkholderiales bacterium]|jgi:3-hydroxybutyrate dehydrogenase|nr:3-hydroxybutyrate dehydrogenase [Burkholderiales bacterium]